MKIIDLAVNVIILMICENAFVYVMLLHMLMLYGLVL